MLQPTKPLLAKCRSCKKPIFWVVTEQGNKMPVDSQSTADGNIIFINRLAHVLRKDEVVPEGEKRWISHYATCPQAAEHRKKGKKEPQLTLHLNVEMTPGFYPSSIKFGVDPEMEVEVGHAVTLHYRSLTKTGKVTAVEHLGKDKMVTANFVEVPQS